MNTQLLSVTKASKNATQLSIQCEWLPRMGFVPGALVMALPDGDGISFTLCDDKIASYSELLHQTKEGGGRLINVGGVSKNNIVYSSMSLALGRMGNWDSGNPVVIGYDYGIIRVRRLPFAENLKYRMVSYFVDKRQNRIVASLVFRERWLNDFGFVEGAVAVATPARGSIAITLWDDSLCKYGELVKHVRQNRLKLIQVSSNNKVPIITITGAFVTGAGFDISNLYSIDCSYGLLQLQTLDCPFPASDDIDLQ